jgi:DNA-binding transcriptional MerR regulator
MTTYLSLTQAADDLGVPAHVLRFWETKFSTLKPMLRGSRRLYSETDMAQLRRIQTLLYEKGYTIRVVQAMLVQETALPLMPAPIPAPAVHEPRIEPRIEATHNALLEELRACHAVLRRALMA